MYRQALHAAVQKLLPIHYAQLARFGLGIERHPGLFKNPRFDALMVLARKRREQDLIKLTWESALKHADAALRGVLELARNKGWSPPEISYAPSSHQSSICLDVAWPNQRLGISLGVVQPEDLKSWRIWSLREALSNLNTDSSSQMGGGSRWGY